MLEESDVGSWLDPNLHDVEAATALVAGGQSDFQHFPVSTRLNAAKEDEEKLVEPVAI